MATARSKHRATALFNGRVLVAGGLSDPATGSFSPIGGMASGHVNQPATLLSNGKVLAVVATVGRVRRRRSSGERRRRRECAVFYWRDRNREVDFVVRVGRQLTAIEVKSGPRRDSLPGTSAFAAAFSPDRTLLVGSGGIPIDEFLTRPAVDWVGR